MRRADDRPKQRRAGTQAWRRAVLLPLATVLLSCTTTHVREAGPAPAEEIKPFTLKLTDEMNRRFGFAFDERGRRAAISGHKGAVVEVLDLATQKTLVSLQLAGLGGKAVAFGNGGRYLATVPGAPTMARPAGRYQGVQLVAVSDAGTSDWIQVWDIATAAEIGVLEAPKPVQCLGSSGVEQLFFSADGARVLAGSGGVNCGRVSLWGIQNQLPIWSQSLGSTLSALALSPDWNHLAVGNGTEFQRPTQILDGSDGRTIASLAPALYGTVEDLAFSPRGDLLAVGRDTAAVRPLNRTDEVIGGIELWRTQDWTLAATVPIPWKNPGGNSNWVRSLSFSPDGTLLAYSTAAGVIEVLNVSTRERRTIRYDAASILFSPDGKHLAALREKTLSLQAVPGQ